jgi:hypothetical protein
MLVPDHKDLRANRALKENKDLLVLKVRKENQVPPASKVLKENKDPLDRPDLLGLLAVGHVKVLQKDTRLAFYRSMA